ncbi:hypothetical protein [Litoribrevibacter albus]|uniref:RHS repeat protein n=1 Tax=Litoribrevibacter albus TaxID=1473156 RepID=A0AA37SFM6_9GAMM|nr:hypothetical protein [Litoribrevibacter albus]GLQ33575.1 hypothetical protein GCM10007876_40550 [Litoribrevibacter albus]
MKKTLLVGLTSAVLTACGGGSGSGSDSDANSGAKVAAGEVQIGYLDTVIGLPYRTETRSGITSERGAFEYREGEQVTFTLGKTELATITPQANLTLFQLMDNTFTLPRTAKDIRIQLRLHEQYEVQTQLEALNRTPKLAQISELHQASNVMQLLLALDSDKDASNGFDLTQTQWITALEGLDYTFALPLKDFFKSEAMISFQQETGISLAMDKATPLKALYELGGITVSAKIRAQELDFTPMFVSSTNYVLNEFGQPTAMTKDGREQEEISIEYDDNGNVTKETHRVDGDKNGSYDRSFVYDRAWNDFNMPTSYEYTYYSDILTTVSNTNFTQYTYQDNRTRLSERGYVIDNNGDGTFDTLQNTLYQYDENGRIVNKTINQVDADGNVIKPISIDTQYYDNEGRVERYISRGGFDINGENPTSNSIYTFTYEGNTVSQTLVEDGLTSVYIETYNEDGLLTLKEATLFDADEQLIYQSSAPFTYDEMGRLTQCEVGYREQAGDPIQLTYRLQYAYDENGLSTLTNQRISGDLIARESTLSIEYGDEGQQQKFTQTADFYTDYNYSRATHDDALGHLIHENYLNNRKSFSRSRYCFADASVHR